MAGVFHSMWRKGHSPARGHGTAFLKCLKTQSPVLSCRAHSANRLARVAAGAAAAALTRARISAGRQPSLPATAASLAAVLLAAATVPPWGPGGCSLTGTLALVHAVSWASHRFMKLDKHCRSRRSLPCHRPLSCFQRDSAAAHHAIWLRKVSLLRAQALVWQMTAGQQHADSLSSSVS